MTEEKDIEIDFVIIQNQVDEDYKRKYKVLGQIWISCKGGKRIFCTNCTNFSYIVVIFYVIYMKRWIEGKGQISTKFGSRIQKSVNILATKKEREKGWQREREKERVESNHIINWVL